MASALAPTASRQLHPTRQHRSSPPQGLRQLHRRDSENLASVENPAGVLLKVWPAYTSVSAFNREVLTILFRDEPRFVEIADDMRLNQNDQFRLPDDVVLGIDDVADDRDIADDR